MAGRHRKRPPRRPTAGAGIVVLTAGAVATTALVTTLEAEAADGVNWDAIIACESGGNPKAVNPSSTASGLFQFLDSSWRAYGGGQYAARAKDATPDQQYAVANKAFAMSGLSPWAASRSCWAGKTISVSKPTVPKHAKLELTADTGTYTVKAGDTLSSIATKETIADPNMIYPGQTLKLK
jgi:LysM repeat protein